MTETLVNATTITLVGSAADIETYLDTASNIQFTAGSNVNGTAAYTLSIAANDGNGSGDVSLGTVNMNVTAVNDAPSLSGLDGTPAFTEGGSAVQLDGDVTVSDVELDALNGGNGDYSGAQVTIVRNGGANASDSYTVASGSNLTVAGSNISAGGNVIATMDTSTPGQISISFVDNGTTPTTALVNEVMQAILYANTSDDPSASVQLDWTFSDDNSGNAQGTGDNPGTATGSVTVTNTNVNDAPTLTATGGNPTYVEGAGASDLFNTVTASAVETGDRFTSLTLTVTNVSDGADEILSFDGTDIALTDGNSVTTATNGLSVSVSVTGSTATVSFTGATLTSAQLQTLVDGLTYRNASDDPTVLGNRVITITGIADDGGTSNGGIATAAPNLSSTVSITAVNDPPVIGNLNGNQAAVEPGSVAGLDDGSNATVTNPDSTDYNGGSLTISDTGDNNTVDGDFSVDGTTVTSGGDATVAAGETIAVGGVTIGTVDATNDGQGGNSLQINFNVDATNPRIETLLQNLTWGAAAGSGAQTFTVTLNDADGRANGGDEDTTANVTMVLANKPVVGNLDGDAVTFTEGGGDVALDQGAAVTLTDADGPANLNGGNMTVTVGTGAAPAEDVLTLDTSGTVSLAGTTAGSNVSVGGVVIGTLGNTIAAGNDLVVNFNANATPARVQALLQSVTYSNGSEAPTEGDRDIEITVTDDDGLVSDTATVSVTVEGVNDAPVFTGVDATPGHTEGAKPVNLDPNATVADAELDAADSYDGATLTLVRAGGANAEDVFYPLGFLASLDEGDDLDLGSGSIGTVTTNSGGMLVLTFNANATAADVDQVLQSIEYQNTSDAPPASVEISYSFDDGNTGAQGSGGAGSDTDDSVTVSITALNDNPGGSLTIDGSAFLGSTLSVNNAITDPDGLSGGFTYQWLRGGNPIPGATNATYTLVGDDLGEQISVVATYTDDGGTLETVTSGTTGTVRPRPAPPPPPPPATISGDDGPNDISGGSGSEDIQSGGGNDTVLAGAGNDTVGGGSGNDRLLGGDGDDEIDGGDGRDTLNGGDGDDDIRGGDGDDRIWAGPDDEGDDTMSGEAGNDKIGGGAGDDSLNGGTGDDTLFGGTGDDSLQGGDGADTLYGGNGDDLVEGGAGSDRIWGSTGADTVNGGAGSDTLGGGSGADSLSGGNGADSLFGGAGDDTVNGGAGNDTLFNGGGADLVTGGDGQDLLWGGAGDDTLTGGADADTFAFTAGTGTDTITDFEAGTDVIQLTGYGVDFDDLVIESAAGGTRITIGGEVIFLDGITPGALGESDFVFV